MATPYLDREKQLRSVFVGNIPFEATEAELREKFEQAGPIVSFRLVHDRESGKPKGYGFIEYQDAATANSCVRNLNNVEYNGRPLRVGPAAGDQNADIKALQQALGGLQQESPYGPPIDPVEAPEAISKAVSSLPPEQMFELMKQMKICIQNNPNEARNMLLQNPQLAYALLQAQIVMKIVDPQVAMALLHREREPAQPILNDMETQRPVLPNPVGSQRPSGGLLGEHPGSLPSNKVDPRSGLLDSNRGQLSQPDRWGNSPVLDPRGISPRERGNNYNPGPVDRRDSSGASRAGDVDFRNRGPPGPEYWAGDPRDRSRGPPPASFGPQDPARGQQMSGPSRGGQPSQYPPQVAPGGRQPAPPAARGVGAIDEEKEKAALIVQVLQLTDEQIQQLPPDQRQSILILKQQIGAAR